MFDGDTFCTFELKSVGTKSISFEREKTDKGVIHKHQIDNLDSFSKYRNISSGFIFDFRLSEKTYFLPISEFIYMIDHLDKKSFNENDMLELCNPINIDKKKLRVNWKYNIEKLLDDIRRNKNV